MTKIAGNTVGVPNPQPDWNQTDETKADYIKNKPSFKDDKNELVYGIARLSQLNNLLNPNDPDVEIDGYYYDNYGSIEWMVDRTYSQSGYIPVLPGSRFITGTVSSQLRNMYFVFYNKNKEVITCKNLIIAIGETFVVPSNPDIAYMRLPFKQGQMLFIGDELSNVYLYNYKHLCEEYSSLFENMKQPPTNLFNPDDPDIEKGGFYDGVKWIVESSYSCSGFIPVKRLEKFVMGIREVQNKTITIPFYNKDKVYLSQITSSNNGVFTVPDNVNIAYMRVPVKTENINKHMVVKSETLPLNYIPYNSKTTFIDVAKDIDQIKGSHWTGKKWYAYGTSLTSESAGTGKYTKYVAELGGLRVTNKGIGGGALVANRNIYNALMSTTDGKVDADLITIEVGANDASTPLGEITSMDTNTFCGALNTCIKNILTNCPKAQVVLMCSTRGRYSLSDSTPYDLDYQMSGGYTCFERDEAIRKVAVANGIYYIPFGSLGLGLFRAQANNLYVTDNIHHTELGGYNLAQGVWSYLKNIPLWYNELPQ